MTRIRPDEGPRPVCCAGANSGSTLIKFFHSDLFFADRGLAADASRHAERGEPLPPDRYPKAFYGEYRDKRMPKQPDIFSAGGFWVISAEFAEVLGNFQLGHTAVYPVRLFQFDRKTPVEGDYFCLAFGETKDAFLSDNSPRARKQEYTDQDVWLLPYDPKDYDLAVSTKALDGVDLWMDPKVRNAFFLSDRLVKALKAANLTRRLGLRRCRVV